MSIGIVGLGYVGLPLAVEFARAGEDVIGVDVDAGQGLRRSARAARRWRTSRPTRSRSTPTSFTFTTRAVELHEAEAILVCVPTPLNRNREPDLGPLLSAAQTLAGVIRKGQLVVLESTTFPGTTREHLVPLLEESGLHAGKDFALAFSPERVDPGRTDFTIRNTPKLVGGLTSQCTERALELYGRVCETLVPVSTPEVAELAKLLENIFRSVNIALVNELAILADRMGIDIWEVVDAAATKPFGFMRFEPGPGMGGHCLPVDPFYLTWKAREYDMSTEFIELAGKVNQQMPYFCLEKIERALNDVGKPVNGSRILLVGVSYKPGVGDLRESPALKILELLRARGGDVAYHDPHVPELTQFGLSKRRADERVRPRGDRHRPSGGRSRRDRRARAAGARPARRHARPARTRREPAIGCRAMTRKLFAFAAGLMLAASAVPSASASQTTLDCLDLSSARVPKWAPQAQEPTTLGPVQAAQLTQQLRVRCRRRRARIRAWPAQARSGHDPDLGARDQHRRHARRRQRLERADPRPDPGPQPLVLRRDRRRSDDLPLRPRRRHAHDQPQMVGDGAGDRDGAEGQDGAAPGRAGDAQHLRRPDRPALAGMGVLPQRSREHGSRRGCPARGIAARRRRRPLQRGRHRHARGRALAGAVPHVRERLRAAGRRDLRHALRGRAGVRLRRTGTPAHSPVTTRSRTSWTTRTTRACTSSRSASPCACGAPGGSSGIERGPPGQSVGGSPNAPNSSGENAVISTIRPSWKRSTSSAIARNSVSPGART